MKKPAIALLVISGLVSGCVVYDDPPRHPPRAQGDRDRDGVPNRADRDRDGDGVANPSDRRPNDPRRY